MDNADQLAAGRYSWFTPGGDPNAGKELPVTLTFEGGGARGLLHIGALRALEEVERSHGNETSALPIYKVRGVNGTSIGSIIAALYSVGYTSNDMLDEKERRSTILELTGHRHAKHLLNKRQRFAIWCIKRSAFATWAVAPAFVSVVFLLALAGAQSISQMPHLSAAVGILFSGAAAGYIIRSILTGLGSAKKLGNFVDLALVAKLNNLSKEEIAKRSRLIRRGKYQKAVKFAHLGRAHNEGRQSDSEQQRAIRPAIIATNLTTGRLEKFSVSRTPDVYVGDAVAASCSVPFLFSPYEIAQAPQKAGAHSAVGEPKTYRYADGGITSNLPVWTSDVPRATNPDMVSISFGTIDDVESEARTPKDIISSLARSALFGAGVLETRRTRNVPYLLRGEEIGLLSFAVNVKTAINQIDEAHKAVWHAMLIRSNRRAIFANAARRLAIEVAQLTPTRFEEGAVPLDAIRITFLEPTRFGQNALKRYFLYCSDPTSVHFLDSNMVYHGEHSLPGEVWDERGGRFAWALPTHGFEVDEQIIGRRAYPGRGERSDERLRSLLWPSSWACAYRLSVGAMTQRYGGDDATDPKRSCVLLVQSNVPPGASQVNSPPKMFNESVEASIRAFDKALKDGLGDPARRTLDRYQQIRAGGAHGQG